MNLSVAQLEFALCMGDNALILGHRLSEWCGHAPVLEEDLAVTNTALDLLGQARRWFGLAGELEGKGRDEDAFAFRRDTHEFRNVLMVEQDNGDYADTMARQLYFDVWHELLLHGLMRSTNARFAEIAGHAHTEVLFHARRSADLVVRLGDGSEESHRRMQRSINEFWIFTGELFEISEGERMLIDVGAIPAMELSRRAWEERVERILVEATLSVPRESAMRTGGRRGVHSEQLGYLLAEMQYLPRTYPDATW